MHKIVHHGNIAALQLAIKHGADVNCRNGNGKTPLMAALLGNAGKAKKREVVNILLAAGANTNAKDQGGNSILHIAVRASVSTKIVRSLLDCNADHTTVDKNNKTARQLAFELNNSKLGHLLFFHESKSIDHGNHWIHNYAFHGKINELRNVIISRSEGIINLRNNAGHTPLMMALYGDTDKKKKGKTIDLLLRAGADVNIKNNNGDSVLHVAVKAAIHKVISRRFVQNLLNHGADKTIVDEKLRTPSKLAYEVGNIKLGELLFCDRSPESKDYGNHKIHHAAHNGLIDLMVQSVAAGDDLNCQNSYGKTPLMLALLGDTNENVKDNLVKTLLNKGAKVNMTDKDGYSVLHTAVIASTYQNISEKSVRSLLLYGADKTLVDKNGLTAFQLAYKLGDVNLGSLLQPDTIGDSKYSQHGCRCHQKGIFGVEKYVNTNAEQDIFFRGNNHSTGKISPAVHTVEVQKGWSNDLKYNERIVGDSNSGGYIPHGKLSNEDDLAKLISNNLLEFEKTNVSEICINGNNG